MLTYEAYQLTRAGETQIAQIKSKQCSPSSLRKNIHRARESARYLVKVLRSNTGPAFNECRSEMVNALRSCRIACRVSAHALQLQGAAQ